MKRNQKITIRPATLQDAELLAQTMRQADIVELAATGTDPLTALIESVERSVVAWTAENDDGIICMWGVAPASILGGIGAVWLLGSDLVTQVKKRFLIETLKYVAEMRELFPVLINYVMVGNDVSQRWLRWAGAKFYPPIKINGVWFQPFVIGN